MGNCLGFLDSYRFLSSSLDKLVRSTNSFPITQSPFGMDENCLDDELLKKKLAYPYEYFTQSAFGNFQEPLILTKEDFWSTLKQKTPSDEEVDCTQEIFKKFNTKNGQNLNTLYLKMDALQLAEVFENFVQTSTEEYGINPLYSYLTPGYSWKTGLKMTKIKLDFIKDKNYYHF